MKNLMLLEVTNWYSLAYILRNFGK
ncbi:ybaK / prolyl-tRNA synthetases associated domain protein, partial [Chlamydia psittaci C1/97]